MESPAKRPGNSAVRDFLSSGPRQPRLHTLAVHSQHQLLGRRACAMPVRQTHPLLCTCAGRPNHRCCHQGAIAALGRDEALACQAAAFAANGRSRSAAGTGRRLAGRAGTEQAPPVLNCRVNVGEGPTLLPPRLSSFACATRRPFALLPYLASARFPALPRCLLPTRRPKFGWLRRHSATAHSLLSACPACSHPLPKPFLRAPILSFPRSHCICSACCLSPTPIVPSLLASTALRPSWDCLPMCPHIPACDIARACVLHFRETE